MGSPEGDHTDTERGIIWKDNGWEYSRIDKRPLISEVRKPNDSQVTLKKKLNKKPYT